MKNKKIILTIISVALLISVIYITYAFFISNNNPFNSRGISTTTPNIEIEYSDCASGYDHCKDITADGLRPGDTIVKTFQVWNKSTVPLAFTLEFNNLVNTFQNNELVYKLEDISNINSPTVVMKTRALPYYTTETSNIGLVNYVRITANQKKQYRLTLTFINSEYDQSYNMNAHFSLQIGITGTQELDYIKNYSNSTVFGRTDITRAEVKSIETHNTLNIQSNIPSSQVWDISNSGKGTYLAWYDVCSEVPEDWSETNCYELHLSGQNSVVANMNSLSLFNNYSNMIDINLEYFDTTLVTIMGEMFKNCSKLESLNVSNFDTSNVTYMRQIFYDCSSLVSLDVSGFDTSNVTDMNSMFYGCSSLSTLDISNFNTSNVTTMYGMFMLCSSLTTIDLKKFDTSSVTDMGTMFFECTKLATLDVSGFDTSNVTNMGNMIRGTSIETIDVSNFDTSNVTNMAMMFHNNNKIISLDLSSFDTSKVENMQGIFSYCRKLTSVNLSSFDTSNVINMKQMFLLCQSLSSLDLSNFNLSKLTTTESIDGMFTYCSALAEIKTPAVMTSQSIALPKTFKDSSGNSYTELNDSTPTQTLLKTSWT